MTPHPTASPLRTDPPRRPASRRAGRRAWAAGLLALACGPAVPEGPSLVLLTLDTVRADALSCYGGRGTHTPHLDALAARGTRYTNAHSSVPLTLPAHATLLTGLAPIRHGVRDNGLGALPEPARTLAESAREAGYDTAAFLGSVVLDPVFGLDQGFDVYDAPRAGAEATAGEHGLERPARAVVDAALDWLAGRADRRPYLVWLHFYDAHTPYTAPTGTCAELAPGSTDLPVPYLREVCAMDAEIGRFLRALEEAGELAPAAVLAVGDHGESFGEHGEHGHSALCFDTTLRVPLLVKWPGDARAGTKSDALVGLVDVLPTLTELAGLATPADLDGHPLDSAPPDRGLYFESYYGYLSFGWSPLAGWLDAAGKYVHSSRPQLYDLAADPGETTNLVDERRDEVRRYQHALARLAERPRLELETGGIGDEVLESLRGLGYVAVGDAGGALPDPLVTSPLPNPAAMIFLYNRSLEALQDLRAGRIAEGVAILEGVRAQNPENPFVLDLLGSAYLQEERFPEAAELLRSLVEVSRKPQPVGWAKLGACLLELDDREGAIEALERSLELDGTQELVRRELVAALRDSGRLDEAAAQAALLGRGSN